MKNGTTSCVPNSSPAAVGVGGAAARLGYDADMRSDEECDACFDTGVTDDGKPCRFCRGRRKVRPYARHASTPGVVTAHHDRAREQR